MSNGSRAALAAFIFLGSYAFVFWLAVRWALSRLLRRANLAAKTLEGIGAKIIAVRPSPGLWQPATVEFELDGNRRNFHVRHWGRSFVLLSVHVESPPLPAIFIRAENAADRLGKSLGLNREVQLGDATFDAGAYITSNASDDIVRRALESSEVRAQVVEVLRLGYRVDMSGEGLRATNLQYALNPFDATQVPHIVRALDKILPALPKFDASEITAPRVSPVSMPIIASATVSALGVIALLTLNGVAHAPFDDMNSIRAMGFGLIAWVGSLAVLAMFIRHRPQGFFEFIVSALALGIGIPALTALALFAFNSTRDASPATTHRVTVTSLARRDHTVYFDSWRTERRDHVGMPFAQFRTVHVGDQLDIDTHPGALGWMWVSAVRKVE